MHKTTICHAATGYAAVGAVLSFLIGCSPGSPVGNLPYDSKLESIFNTKLGARAQDLDVSRVALLCDNSKKLKMEVDLLVRTSRGDSRTVPLATNTPCSDEGLLVNVSSDGGGGYTIRAKYTYDQDLVLGQWQTALTSVAGTLDYSEAITEGVRTTYGQKLAGTPTYDLDFICDEKSNTVHYKGDARGDLREGSLSVICPVGSEKGHSILRLLSGPTPASWGQPSEAERIKAYRVLVTDAVGEELAKKLIERFLAGTAPRDKF